MNKSYTLRNRLGIYELYRSRVRFVFPLWGYSPFGDNYDLYLNFENEMVFEHKRICQQMQDLNRK